MSLYYTFFPDHFGRNYTREVRRGCSRWVNFWRETDAISSKVPGARNRLLPDPTGLGHSDYWIDDEVVAETGRFLAAATPPGHYRGSFREG